VATKESLGMDSMEKNIIQISDLHFGEYKFSEELKNNLKSQILEENPDLIIIAGDITTMGYIDEYIDAMEFIDELTQISRTYVVPGNHDSCNVGLVHFQKLIGNRKFSHADKGNNIAIIGLDSSEPDVHSGKIGIDQLEWLKNELDKIPKDMYTLITFHHHLLPVPLTGRERNILLDSGDTLKLLMDYGVNMVLNGHKHVANAWKLDDMLILTSGTATTRRLHADTCPSYNQLMINDQTLSVNLIRTETGQKKQLARYSLNTETKNNEDILVNPSFH
jgi:3',5'-cyclic AMP phosphodiesterase CpdA